MEERGKDKDKVTCRITLNEQGWNTKTLTKGMANVSERMSNGEPLSKDINAGMKFQHLGYMEKISLVAILFLHMYI